MENVLNPLKKKKKISLDLNEEFLGVIDEVANLTKSNRNTIIEALISRGIFPYFNYLEQVWKRFLDEGRYKENKRMEEEITRLIKDLGKIKSKHQWLNSDYYWEMLLSKKNLDEETKKGMIRLLQDIDLVPTDKEKFKKLLK